MINLFGSNALLGTSFNDVFSIVFFGNKIFKRLNVPKNSSFSLWLLTSQLLKSNKVDKIHKNVILCAWKITRLFLHYAFVSSLLCSTFSTKVLQLYQFSLHAKKRTGGKTTTYICTGVNTAKKIICLRVAFDFFFFFNF